MKMKTMIPCLICLLAFGAVLGTTIGLLCAKRMDHNPRLSLPDGNVHDLGLVDEGKLETAVFRIQNTGRAPLQIGKVFAGCGCVKAQVSDERIEPHAEAELHVEYTVRPLNGSERASILVTTNDPRRPQVEFVVLADIRRSLYWYPRSVSLGRTCRTAKVRLVPGHDDAIEVTGLSQASEHFAASSGIDEKGVYIVLRLSIDNLTRNTTEYVKVDVVVGGTRRQIELPVYVMGRTPPTGETAATANHS